nr:MAG TPA: hypothetical protein [Caudoviricetes sp.]
MQQNTTKLHYYFSTTFERKEATRKQCYKMGKALRGTQNT